MTQVSPSPRQALRRSWVSSFLLNYVNNPKATEKKQTALFMALCSELSCQADPRAAARYPAWLLPYPPALGSVPGSRCLVHKEMARCLLPAGLATCWLPVTRLLLPCSPAGIALLSWCPESPAEWQVVSSHPVHLFLHFFSKCTILLFFLLLFWMQTTHTHIHIQSHLPCLSACFFPAHESAWISWCGAAGSI